MTDKVFIELLKTLEKQKREYITEDLNEQVLDAFPDKAFLEGQKRAKSYFQKLVVYYLGIVEKKNLEKVLMLLDTIYKKLYPNLKTLDTTFTSDIRKPIFTRFGRYSPEHVMSKKLAKLSYKDKTKVENDAHDRLEEKHRHVKRFDPTRVMTIIKDTFNTDDVYRQAVGLALASGSRPIELLSMAKYSVLEGTTNWVVQIGIAKKKEDNPKVKPKVENIKKPIIGMTAVEFIEKIGDMRYQMKAENKKILDRNGELASNVEDKCNKAMKELFDYELGIVLYSCRKIYGQLAYELYGGDSILGKDPSIQSFLQQVLGHEDIETSVWYNTYKIKNKEVSSADLAVLQVQISDLEKRLNERGVPKAVADEIEVKVLKNSKLDNLFEKIAAVYDEKKPTTQTELEVLMKGIAPRSAVRLFYGQNVN